MGRSQKMVEVYCHHGDKPKSLGKYHPATIDVYSPECTTKKGVPKRHAGPARNN